MVVRYVTVRLTIAQAEAAENATDLLRDECEADGRKADARIYAAVTRRLTAALKGARRRGR